MELILISCSGEKIQGGSTEFQSSNLQKFLSPNSYNHILSARQSLARYIDEKPSPDLGLTSLQEDILFKPAYQRYSGIIYRRSNFAELFPLITNEKVIIISAFYGILAASDLIRKYELKMTDTLPNGTRLSTWWKSKKLGVILGECIIAIKPDVVHDLLPAAYRNALAPWPAKVFSESKIQYIPYEYPGEGQGSLWHRGEDLRKLISGH